MAKNLSRRLNTCLNALSSVSRIADIGTDHAYLPCEGISKGVIDSAIAIDVIDGPLAQAKATITDYGLGDKIEIRKGSGFEPLVVGEVEGVVIAGMGGKLIAQLLADSLPIAQSMQLLVFQPQGGEYTLRQFLFSNDFEIVDEQLIEEEGIIYTIIVAKPTEKEAYINQLDLTFGPILRRNLQNELFVKKWMDELSAIDAVLNQIPVDNPKHDEFQETKKLIEDVLAGAVNERNYIFSRT